MDGRAAAAGRITGAAVGTGIGAAGVNATLASAAAASGTAVLAQLALPGVVGASVVGGLLAVAGWALVRARAGDPARVLARLVPAVLLLSLVPDALLGVAAAPATGWAPVLLLGSMHVTTALVAVAVCAVALPVARARRPRVAAA